MSIFEAKLLLPDEVKRGYLSVSHGRITAISTRRPRTGKITRLRGGWLAPGFIDLHVHGAAGCDTMEATDAAFRTITGFHLRGGTTSMTLTTLTAPESRIMAVLERAGGWLNRSEGGARVVGVHVEGPFISKARPGAQCPWEIRDPVAAEWRKYLRHGRLISQVTLAPELKGALPLIRALRKNGSIVSGGHTDAWEPQLIPALEAGMNQATHTFNCMSTARKVGPYRQAGMVEFALAHPQIRCELIADGHHVSVTLMQMLYRAKGRDGICLITDAVAAAGMAPGSRFAIEGVKGRVTPEVGMTEDGTTLAGSTLTMARGVKVAVERVGIPLVEAVRMAGLNPARQLGRDRELGSLRPGTRADLVWLGEDLGVKSVWVDGELRYGGE